MKTPKSVMWLTLPHIHDSKLLLFHFLLNPVHLILSANEGSHYAFILCTYSHIICCVQWNNQTELPTVVWALPPCCKKEPLLVDSWVIPLYTLYVACDGNVTDAVGSYRWRKKFFFCPVSVWKYLKDSHNRSVYGSLEYIIGELGRNDKH